MSALYRTPRYRTVPKASHKRAAVAWQQSAQVLLLVCMVVAVIVAAASFWGGTSPQARNRVGLQGFSQFSPEDFVMLPIGHVAAFVRPPDQTRAGVQSVAVKVTPPQGKSYTVRATLRLLRVANDRSFELGKTQFPLKMRALVAEGNLPSEQMEWLEPAEATAPGEYQARLQIDGQELQVPWQAVDTEPPQGKPQTVKGFVGTPLEPTAFLKSIKDATKVVVAFAQEPDWQKQGQQKVHLVLRDEGGNTMQLAAKLCLQPQNDTTPPEILGVHDISVERNGAVAYRNGVEVRDNSGTAELRIDSAGVNTAEPGEYTAVYIATDAAGNETRMACKVRVAPIEESRLRTMAEAVLASLVQPGMSEREQAKAIHTWMRNNVGYTNSGDKNGLLSGAYNGLQQRSGDCYTFYALSTYMLNLCGIRTIDMHRVETARTRHYWVLVNFGEGWLHYDTCPVAKAELQPHGGFLMTTAEANQFGVAIRHPDYYSYDPAILPEGVVPQ